MKRSTAEFGEVHNVYHPCLMTLNSASVMGCSWNKEEGQVASIGVSLDDEEKS
jgi:hypothetical protein